MCSYSIAGKQILTKHATRTAGFFLTITLLHFTRETKNPLDISTHIKDIADNFFVGKADLMSS